MNEWIDSLKFHWSVWIVFIIMGIIFIWKER